MRAFSYRKLLSRTLHRYACYRLLVIGDRILTLRGSGFVPIHRYLLRAYLLWTFFGPTSNNNKTTIYKVH